MSNTTIQEALRELSAIRRIMGQVEPGARKQLVLSAASAAILIHWIAITLGATLLINDLGLCPLEQQMSATALLTLSAQSLFIRIFLLCTIGLVLLTLSTVLYTVLWSAARRQGEKLSTYVARNFAPYSTLSFLSDLCIKYVAIAVCVATKRPEWVSPLLLLFTADYLFQGRFFHLPFRVSLLCGFLALLTGIAQLGASSDSLSIALGVFLLIAITSLINLMRQRQRKDTPLQYSDSAEIEG